MMWLAFFFILIAVALVEAEERPPDYRLVRGFQVAGEETEHEDLAFRAIARWAEKNLSEEQQARAKALPIMLTSDWFESLGCAERSAFASLVELGPKHLEHVMVDFDPDVDQRASGLAGPIRLIHAYAWHLVVFARCGHLNWEGPEDGSLTCERIIHLFEGMLDRRLSRSS